MRRRSFWVAGLIAALQANGLVHAQTLQGPLAVQTAKAPNAPTAKQKHAKVKAPNRRKAATATPGADPAHQPVDGGRAEQPENAKAEHSTAITPDPLSFGMKWSGSNDTAEKTRVQNYNAGADGTGAEVGLKLHF